MPNRILKESICTSDTIDQLNWFEEVFFYRLTVNCDDFGRFDARPSILKARLFPLKQVSERQINEALTSLSKVGLIAVYEYDGKSYLQLITWSKHQTIRNKKSKYPSIDDCNKTIESNCMQLNVNVPVIQSNPIQSESNPNPIQSSVADASEIEDKTKSKNDLPSIAIQIKDFTEDLELQNILNEFVKMRDRIKKKLTPYAFHLILKELFKITDKVDMQKAIINQSITNSWQGIFPLKQYSNYNNNKKVASVPDWYEKYSKQLAGIPKQEKLSPEEAEKVLQEAKIFD